MFWARVKDPHWSSTAHTLLKNLWNGKHTKCHDSPVCLQPGGHIAEESNTVNSVEKPESPRRSRLCLIDCWHIPIFCGGRPTLSSSLPLTCSSGLLCYCCNSKTCTAKFFARGWAYKFVCESGEFKKKILKIEEAIVKIAMLQQPVTLLVYNSSDIRLLRILTCNHYILIRVKIGAKIPKYFCSRTKGRYLVVQFPKGYVNLKC